VLIQQEQNCRALLDSGHFPDPDSEADGKQTALEFRVFERNPEDFPFGHPSKPVVFWAVVFPLSFKTRT